MRPSHHKDREEETFPSLDEVPREYADCEMTNTGNFEHESHTTTFTHAAGSLNSSLKRLVVSLDALVCLLMERVGLA